MAAYQHNDQDRPSFETLPEEVQIMIFQELGIGRNRVVITSVNPGKINRGKFRTALILNEYSLAFMGTPIHAAYNRYISYNIRHYRNVVHVNIKDGDTANLQAFLQQAPLNTLPRFTIATGTDITSDEGLTGPCFAARLKYTRDFSYDDSNVAYINMVKAINKHVARGHLRMFYRVMDDFERSPGLSLLLQDMHRNNPEDDFGQARFMNNAIRKRFSDPERTVGQMDEMNNMLGVRDINQPRVQDDVEEESLGEIVDDDRDPTAAANAGLAVPFALSPALRVLVDGMLNGAQLGMPGGPGLHAGVPHGLPMPQPTPQTAALMGQEVDEEVDDGEDEASGV